MQPYCKVLWEGNFRLADDKNNHEEQSRWMDLSYFVDSVDFSPCNCPLSSVQLCLWHYSWPLPLRKCMSCPQKSADLTFSYLIFQQRKETHTVSIWATSVTEWLFSGREDSGEETVIWLLPLSTWVWVRLCEGTYWIILMYVSTFIMSPSLQSFLKPITSVFGLRRPRPAAWEGGQEKSQPREFTPRLISWQLVERLTSEVTYSIFCTFLFFYCLR